MTFKLKNHNSYSEIIFKINKIGEIPQYKRFSSSEFFDVLNLSSKHFYSEYFKKRLHELCIQGVVRPEQFCKDMNSTKKVLAQRGYLNCLSKYKIKHEHIDTNENGFIINFNNHLKLNRIKLSSGDIDRVMSNFLNNYPNRRTGHWVIYKTFENKKYYLDVCEHGADEYLKTTGIQEYLNECPHIF